MAKKPIQTDRRKFGSSRAHGLQLEFAFRRDWPLDDADREELHEHIEAVVRANRKTYSRFFVSLLITVLGGLYQTKFGSDDDDDPSWEHQWVSTPVVKKLKDLHAAIDELLDDTVDFQIAERPAKLLRYRVVFISNK